jgi:hypothetical protein
MVIDSQPKKDESFDWWMKTSIKTEEEERGDGLSALKTAFKNEIKTEEDEEGDFSDRGETSEGEDQEEEFENPPVSPAESDPEEEDEKPNTTRRKKRLETGHFVHIRGEFLHQDQLETAIVARTSVGNQCRFRCLRDSCDYQNTSWRYLKEHLNVEGHTTSRQKRDYAVQIAGHECQACLRVIFNDKTIIKHHVVRSHQLTLTAYCQKYKLASPPSLSQRKAPPSSQISQDKVGNMCQFRCPQDSCWYQNNTWRCMREHLKAKGHYIPSRPTGDYASYAVKMVYHECRECRRAVLNDRFMLRVHLKFHKLTLVEYCQTYRLTLLPVRELKPQQTPAEKKKRVFQSHSKRILQDLGLRVDEISDTIGNKCRYQCQTCKKNMLSYKTLEEHLKIAKHSTCTDRGIAIEKFISRVVTHKCLLCSEVLLCDEKFFASHAKLHHGLTVNQYRAKFELENPNLRATKEKQLKALLTGAIVSESIGNLCTFQCQVCLKTFDSKWKFHLEAGHLNEEKEICTGSSEHSSLFFWQNAVKRVVHKCRLCGEMLLCDSHELSYHFTREHKVTMKEYSHLTGAQLRGSVHDVKERMRKLQNSSRMEKSVGNFCKFECNQCDFRAFSWIQMKEHFVKQQHGNKINSAPDFATEAVLHQCRTCTEKVLCDKFIISLHLRTKHRLSVKQYIAEGALKGSKDIYDEKLKEVLAGIPTVQKPLPKRCNPGKVLPDSQLTKSVGNLCLFECPLCQAASHSWKTFQCHMRAHKGMKKWLTFDTKYVKEARYHRCLLCGTEILCDKTFIRDHINRHSKAKKEKMDFPKYVKLVEESGGRSFPTFREWQSLNPSEGL